ncbi:MAG: 4-(cytidine 5'-diphospho)-2-C-methyl-D-erythritol kinase [Bacteroidetes bacterium]|nr:4-(cytidine 5'-diphospho)-2-C-methyl-D-erythritol kinase [Bacteroidota bacterium]
MISFPNGKINLGLQVTGIRTDGYHQIETIFYPIGLKEIIEIIPSENFQFTVSGLQIEGTAGENLCARAYHILKNDFPSLPAIHLWLHKRIPMGAGLGGGSADGAFTLQLLNDNFQLNLSTNQLIGYASQLGSDCPFFILNKPCYATGRGELLNPIELDLSGYCFVIVYPNVHISTGWAFSQLNPMPPSKKIIEIIRQPIEAWKKELKNDFEEPVTNKYPELSKIKEQLYEAGALYASISGSGSAFYGIFKKGLLPPISFSNAYETFIV